MFKQLLILSLLVCATATAQAQDNGHRISITIKGLRDSTCYLAHAYENMYSILDTAKMDANGTMVFKGTKKLPGGLYTLAIGKSTSFDLLMSDDQDFNIDTDTSGFYRKNLRFSGSEDNEIFTEFQQKWMEIAQRKQGQPADKQRLIDQELEALQKTYVNTHKGKFVANILKANMTIDIPPMPAKPTRRDTLAQAQYFWNHFWDNIDLSDERMLRVPFLKPRLEYFLENISYFSSDSINRVLDSFLARTRKGTDLRKYLVMKSTYHFEVPKSFILGNDSDINFIHLAQKYYINEPSMWDTSSVRKIKERVEALRPLVLGTKLPNMQLTDTLTLSKPLYGVNAKYTIVYFYSPDCHHCQESMPKLAKNYQTARSKGIDVRVYAVEIDRNVDKWKKFIREYKIKDFINVTDHYKITDFKTNYDVRTTPTIYVLDRDKKIIAKKIGAEQVEALLEAFEKQEKDKLKAKASTAGK
jgi:thiol-disulfide isomerase/thioredoxin